MNSKIKLIESKIENAITKYRMLENASAVIIGVSGGADSMALLKFFEEYSKKNKINLIAAHVNHCLRGKESDRDENFVRDYCQKNGISLKVLRINVKEFALSVKKGEEESARELRYEYFNELSLKYDSKIATAHTLSDSVETMLINLTRGTGITGLCGIPAKRGNIIRPLIELKRTETKTYCKENGIDYVTDSTNLSRNYTRNKIRLDVIPLLKQINPEFEVIAARTASLLKADEEYLDEVAKKFLKESMISSGTYVLKNVKKQSLPVLSRFVRLAVFEYLKSNLTAQHVELILNLIRNNCGAVVLPQKIKISVENDTLLVKKFEKKLNSVKNKCEFPFKPGYVLTENSEKFIIKVLRKDEFDKFEELQFSCAMDYDKIGMDANFRTRRAGDKFCKAGRGVTKSVKKLFNELKIPQNKRDEVIMLADGREILWINNVGISEKVKVTKSTQKVVVVYSE